jgi:hypothetical protein
MFFFLFFLFHFYPLLILPCNLFAQFFIFDHSNHKGNPKRVLIIQLMVVFMCVSYKGNLSGVGSHECLITLIYAFLHGMCIIFKYQFHTKT